MSALRANNLRKLSQGTFDVLVIGGGINGAVAAACLSARGVRVALVDQGDFASFTSEQSSNLAWGGIKYMETLEFPLVRKLCLSRNHLIRSYPSTVQEIRFFALHSPGFRYRLWLLWVGTWVYWLIGNCFTKKPRLLSRATIAAEEPVVDAKQCDGGFEYSDAYLHDNDARFVFNFVRSALNYGGVMANYVQATGAVRDESGVWNVRARDVRSGQSLEVRAKVLINAAGPFVDALNGQVGIRTPHRHVFSKGIHLIVDRITPHRRVLTFFADDGRLFFVIPMGPRTCLGTTDTRVEEPHAYVTQEDRAFVLHNINKRLALARPLTEHDIIAERCGVRPLAVLRGSGAVSDWMQLSRKHAVDVDPSQAHISIFGGKLTDCLNVGEEIADWVAKLGVVVPYPDRIWYGEPPHQTHQEFLHQARLMNLDQLTSPQSSESLSVRLWRRYGAESFGLLEDIRADPKMAEVLIEGAEYLRCEIAQAARREMIVTLADFLRRRSKIALVIEHSVLERAPGLRDACRLLFGDDAEARFYEYFVEKEDERRRSDPPVSEPRPSVRPSF